MVDLQQRRATVTELLYFAYGVRPTQRSPRVIFFRPTRVGTKHNNGGSVTQGTYDAHLFSVYYSGYIATVSSCYLSGSHWSYNVGLPPSGGLFKLLAKAVDHADSTKPARIFALFSLLSSVC